MLNKKIILIDQDGVLANYQESLHAILAREHPTGPWRPIHELVHHDTEKNYSREWTDVIEEIVLRKGFYRNLPPIVGGCEALEYLLAQGNDVRICTAPKRDFRNCTLEKLEWIDEHFGRKWSERTIITRDKTLVSGDILIDDKPNVKGVRQPSWEHIFYDQPYNRTHKGRRLTWTNYKEVLGV
ncbi:MAG: hypothetical protein A3C93_00145 [Candidatus Lloydbacteria bacterium RIFCSPHIGHO2_02_FULL_54_17]|uniref:Uncharacterized protein n=1 Tax=Candidatus Lloydbacteria bacterium RIFCSPHIGHO2_02_FULL_54_17 TaxID=1798664 RepID=A0A1G2DI09_9BACT|nr:MAG: hypothetical protein A3C93_00145 [Candidatus Lloydbacteria bacterium RIFCSPHIGHO2_02_FULL_54_17]OGZ17122.1 MAG: hypothetical protein A3H76_02945 [Candidatus Lloydbacteria bacterium RIFCSPLOWO2_02_FULL_54_12]